MGAPTSIVLWHAGQLVWKRARLSLVVDQCGRRCGVVGELVGGGIGCGSSYMMVRAGGFFLGEYE